MSFQRSVFYYSFNIDEDNRTFSFSEGGPAIVGTLDIGEYSMTGLALELKKVLDALGALTYFVTPNRDTRTFQIESTSPFELLVQSGGSTAFYALIGFTGVDRTGASEYFGNLAAGDFFETQFPVQDYVGPEDLQERIGATVNESGSGRTQVSAFGIRKFVEMNLVNITNIDQGSVSRIKTNLTGVEDARRFLQFLTTHAPVEFMKDIGNRNSFLTLEIVSTAESSDGVGYRLREDLSNNLFGFFKTGNLKLRVIE